MFSQSRRLMIRSSRKATHLSLFSGVHHSTLIKVEPSFTHVGVCDNSNGFVCLAPTNSSRGLFSPTRKNLCTSRIPTPAEHHGVSHPTEEEGGESIDEDIQCVPASGQTIKDLHGPWLLMCSGGEGSAAQKELQGELMIYEDGTVTLQVPPIPLSNTTEALSSSETSKSEGCDEQLGNCIGSINLIEERIDESIRQQHPSEGLPPSITVFRIELESYIYQKSSADHPPFAPKRVVITGTIEHLSSGEINNNYKALKLSGVADFLVDGMQALPPMDGTVINEEASNDGEKRVGPLPALNFARAFAANAVELNDRKTFNDVPIENKVHAVKLLPFDPIVSRESLWKPKKDIADGFKMLFSDCSPPLQIDSHVKRAVESARVLLSGEKKQEQMGGGGDDTQSPPRPPFHLDLAPFKVGPIPSIFYIPNYISKKEEQQFMRHLKRTPDSLKTKLNKRTCQEWGGSMCRTCHKSFLADANFPPWVEKVNEMLLYDGIFTPTTFPNSVRIHEYNQYEGIGPHCDGPIYVPLVAVLSMASTSVMHFYPKREPYTDGKIVEHYNDTFKFDDGEIGKQTPIASVVLEPRSLLIFTEDAYTHYPHGVSDKAVDDLGGSDDTRQVVINRHLLTIDPNIKAVKREYRASVTVRNLLPRCGHELERNEWMMRRAYYHYHQLPPPPITEWDMRSSLDENDRRPSIDDATTGPISASTATTVKAGETSSVSTGGGDGGGGGSDLARIQQSLDRILSSQETLRADVNEIKNSVAELKAVLGFSFTSSSTFQKETASILNHLSMAVMDITQKQEEINDSIQSLSDKVETSRD